MAGPVQYHSFVKKFEELWKSGFHASLNIETEAGNVFVNLRLGLGKVPLHPGQVPLVNVKQEESPSRVKRRERRWAARETAAEKNTRVKESTTCSEIAQSEQEANNVEDKVAVDGNENAGFISAGNVGQCVIPKVEETLEMTKQNNYINDTTAKVAENVNSTEMSDEPKNVHKIVNTKIDYIDTFCNEENDKGIEVNNEKKEEVLVFATAVFLEH